MKRVTIIDYDIGNLLSVARAFEECSAEVEFAHTAEEITNAERLILPGVGAFANGMQELRQRSFVEAIQTYARSNKPFMGICLGMQMMLSRSEEFGEHDGLNLIPGKVVPIPATTADGTAHKIPHIGWNELIASDARASWESTLLSDIPESPAVYFVHSFMSEPDDANHRLADCDYDGKKISAAIRSGNLYGCQFHPEKSGPIGLQMIQNFLQL